MALQHGLMAVPVKACDEWAVPLWRRFLQVNERYERVTLEQLCAHSRQARSLLAPACSLG